MAQLTDYFGNLYCLTGCPIAAWQRRIAGLVQKSGLPNILLYPLDRL